MHLRGEIRSFLFFPKKIDKRPGFNLIEWRNIANNAEINRSREEIAKQTSSAREVVIRMSKRFESVGLAKLSRKAVILMDITGSKKSAKRKKLSLRHRYSAIYFPACDAEKTPSLRQGKNF